MYGYPMSMLPQEFADLNRAERMEKARRLSRYDEAIRLLRMISGMAVHWEPLTPGDIREVNNFLAAEPADKETT